MDNLSIQKDRFFSTIKLLPNDSNIRKIALQIVESNLEFSLNNTSLLYNSHTQINQILLSEILKVLIVSDVYAKIQYHEEKFRGKLKRPNLPPIFLLRYGDLPDFLNIYICPKLVKRYSQLM